VVNAARSPVPAARIRSAVDAAAALREVSARLPQVPWELAVRIAGDRELRSLNRRFLGEDHATDVLRFPDGDAGEQSKAEADGPVHLGDVVVSWPAVRRQAAEFGHEPEAEMLLLVVHGFLHVLGWDHASAEEELEMTRLTVSSMAATGARLAPGRLLAAPPPG